jgi:cysteine desulfurase
MNLRSHHAVRVASIAKPIYLDHHSTTPVDRRVVDVMVQAMTEQFGNPNNLSHFFGEEAADVIRTAREAVASLVNADATDVIFTRSAIVGAAKVFDSLIDGMGPDRQLRIAATTVEHSAVLETLARLEQAGSVKVIWLSVDARGHVNDREVIAALDDRCDLMCIMAANNEVGTIYPIDRFAKMAGAKGVPLLVDATQAAGHIPMDVRGWGITYLLTAAHKMYGPKGVAALIANAAANEMLRDLETSEGTPNVPAIAGFGEACRLRENEMHSDSARVQRLRDKLETALVAGIPGLIVNGDRACRMPNNLHISIPGLPNDAVVARLSRSVALSTGAACRWGTDEPSHVLQAMKLPPDIVEGALRLGLGRDTTDQDIDFAAALIIAAAEDTRRAVLGE